MRNGYPSLPLCLKRLRSLAGALLLALGALGVEAQAAPAISSISPESGTATTRVTIKGKSFGSSQGSGRVTFGGLEASRYYQWSDTRIQVRPAAGLVAGTHAVVVTGAGGVSGGVDYTVLGKLTAFCLAPGQTIAEPEGSFEMGVHRSGPTSSALTVTVTYSGTATHGSDYRAPETLMIGAGERRASARLQVIDDAVEEGEERIKYQVSADGYRPGSCRVTLEDNDTGAPPGPEISGLNPTSGEVGTSVTIMGANFGSGGSVTFAGTGANTTGWSGTSITATVPEGATTGAVVVTVNGVASNGVDFTVRAPGPEISGLEPTSGEVGTSVTITGGNFGSGGSVTFAGTGANTTGWSGTSITATVPEGATSGAVVVTVGGVASNGVGFTVGEDIRPLRLLCASSVSEPSGVARYIFAYVGRGNETDEDMTVGLAYSGTATHEADYTAPEALTIPAGRSSGTMSPRLTVVDDRVFEGEERIELTATAEGYETATCTIALEDDEAAPVPGISGLDPVSGPVGTLVAIRGEHFGSGGSVTFNGTAAEPESWSETEIVAAVPEGARTGNVVVTVGGEASAGVPFRVTGVRVTPRELTIEEGGTGTYTVVLASEPASAVTVSMFAPSGTDLSVDILPVFTASNWDEPQTVTVTAGEDEDQEDDRVTLTHRTASADAGYHDLAVDPLEVTITDNDAGAGVRVAPRELTIEEGGEGSYTVVLNTEPAAPVTVTVSAGGDLTAIPDVLTFTALTWDEPQEVTLTAADDEDASDDTETVTHAVTSTDLAYNGIAVEGVRVTIADAQGTGGPGGTDELMVSTTRLRITEGNSGSYTVELSRAPAEAMTVTVSAGEDLTVSPDSLAFTTATWDTPQEVMVTVGEDDDLVDEIQSITHTLEPTSARNSAATARGARFTRSVHAAQSSIAFAAEPVLAREYVYLGGRLVAIEPGDASVPFVGVVVTIEDDDDPDEVEVAGSTASLTITKGNSAKYTLVLGSAPTSNVTITLLDEMDGDVTVSPKAVTFTSTTWDTTQEVTVSVAENAESASEKILHEISDDDSDYASVEDFYLTVFIRDPEGFGPILPGPGVNTISASPNPCMINEARDVDCAVTIDWRSSPPITAVQVWVSHNGAPEGPFTGSRTTMGSQEATWIQGEPHTYTFNLYDLSGGNMNPATPPSGTPLASVVVTAEDSRPNSGPLGYIWAYPNPCKIESGDTCTTSIGWTSRNTSAVRIWRSHNGGPPTPFTDTDSLWGKKDDDSIGESSANSYTFSVHDYSDGSKGDALASVTVTGTEDDISILPTGTITPSATSCEIPSGAQTCSVTLDWETKQTIRVKLLKGSEVLDDSIGFSGRVSAKIKQGDNDFLLKSYTSGDAPPVKLHTVRIRGTSTTDASIWASPNPCTIDRAGDVDCAVTIDWRSSPPITAVQVWVSHNGAPEGPFTGSRTTMGSQEATWIQGEPHTYTFNLYDLSGGNMNPATPPSGNPLASVVVTAESPSGPVGYIWAYPNPCRIEQGDNHCTTSIGWTSRNTSAVRIWRSHNGGTPTPFTDTDSLWGKKDDDSIGESPANRYTFSVHDYSGGSKGNALASVTVTGTEDDISILPTGTITPSATSCEIPSGAQTCSVTLDWETEQTIRVKLLKGSEVLVDSIGFSGSVSAKIKQGDNDFLLKSYTSGDAPPVKLHEITVIGTSTTGPNDPLPDPLSIAFFTANPTSVDLGGQSTLSWSVSGATGLSIDQGVGSVTPLTSGSKEVTPDQSKVTTTYTLTASDTSDEDTTDTASVTINAPRITCSADPATVAPGGKSKLKWTTTSAKSVSIDQEIGSVTPVASGEKEVTPSSTTTYTLTATGSANRTASCTATVTVTGPTDPLPDPPSITSFTANPTSVDLGEQSTLSWSVSGATGLSIDQGVGSVTPLTSGSKEVTPDQSKVTTTYTLTASDTSDEDTTDTASVTINAPRITCSASSSLVNPGDSVTLSWATTNATGVSIDQGVGSVTPVGSGTETVNPSTRTTYGFTATGPGGTASCSATVKVRPVIDSFTADPASITRGQGSELSWTTTNSDSVTLDGSGVGKSGRRTVVPWNTTSYTLRAANGDGQVSKTVTVTVSVPPAPVITSISPSQGVPDSQVTIYGANFSTTQGSVSFGGISAEINSWGATSVSVQVPVQLNRGQVSVSLTALGQTSNSLTFTVTGDSPREECDEDEEDCPERDEEEGGEEDEGEDGGDPSPGP